MMHFSELAANAGHLKINGGNAEIKSLACNIEDVTEGTLFFCITGGRDRHDQIAEAAARGAVALITEHEVACNLPYAIAKSARSAMSLAAKAFYGGCVDKMKLITVTGTNGKTTTTYIIDSILRAAGYKTGLIGTCGIKICGETLESNLTTPDPIALHALFARMYESGVQIVVMEVSAHAVYLKKMEGSTAEVAVFTNLSQDHLDFFGTMAKYQRAKTSYFTPKLVKAAVVNADDETGRLIAEQAKVPCVTYGYDNRADVSAINFENKTTGINYVLNLFEEVHDIKFAIPGKFNMYNSMAAAACCKLLDVDIDTIYAGVKCLTGVDGRFSVTAMPGGYSVVIDYAHTPDGLENVLHSAREICRGKLIAVFGCGGNRDRRKRRMMGEIASRLADAIIITSDNPRNERPADIIADIEKGMDREKYYIAIENRDAAIKYALDFAGRDDVIVIAGKGHEEYQEISGVKYDFSDAEVVARHGELR